jgi:hypothetical protein
MSSGMRAGGGSMGCKKRFLMFSWERHRWQRRVTATERGTHADTNMWGRPTDAPYVVCHAQYVCEDCGAVKDDGECGCDAERGDRCPARVALLAELSEKRAGA